MVGQRFTGTLEPGRNGGAFVVIPEDIVESVGAGGRFRVTGSLNGVEFASSTMPLGAGRVCLGVHKATREAAAVEIGDEVVVEIERDSRPRQIDVPRDLADALAADPRRAAAFAALAFSHRKEYVEWVAGAKRDETRRRRIAQTLDRLGP